MAKVILHMSMSLDGFITGPNDTPEEGLGKGGERLHNWMFEDSTAADAKIVEEWHKNTGAVIMGKHSFDVGVEPWGDNPPFHAPVFVLSHKPHENIEKEGELSTTLLPMVLKVL
jgi:dihydrofolate reductase